MWSKIGRSLVLQVKEMHISVSQAKAKLTDLVRRAERGEEIVLTRHGRASVTLTPLRHTPSAEGRRKVIESVMEAVRNKRTEGPNAARSQDYLYGDEGLPE